jgi:hypothetical protein
MADGLVPGPLGVTPHNLNIGDPIAAGPATSSFVTPGPLGSDLEPEPLADRFVTKVDVDWDPTPKPDTTAIQVAGTTLADLATNLAALPEAGEGGGSLRADPVAAGTSAGVTVTLHGNLVNKVTDWTGYSSASTAAKAEWDRVLTNLKRHEKRHMEIAIEAGNALAKALIGHKIGSSPNIAAKVTAANTAMQAEQDKLDSKAESDHGRKVGHAFGDCNLDTSIK